MPKVSHPLPSVDVYDESFLSVCSRFVADRHSAPSVLGGRRSGRQHECGYRHHHRQQQHLLHLLFSLSFSFFVLLIPDSAPAGAEDARWLLVRITVSFSGSFPLAFASFPVSVEWGRRAHRASARGSSCCAQDACVPTQEKKWGGITPQRR